MWPFKKQRDVIDFTELQKRGILKVPAIKQEEFKDLTSSSSTASGTDSSDAFGFLNSIASSSASNLSQEIKDKINSLHDRIYSLTQRIELLERKIDRMERRSGLKEE